MNLKTRINTKGFIYLTLFIILFSYFESPYLNTIETISSLYNIGKVLSCMLFILLLINNEKFVVPNYIMIVVIYNIYLFTRSLYLGLPVFYVANKVLTSITFFVFIDYFVKYYSKEFFSSLFHVLFILVTINFILMIKYKYGIYNIDDYNRSYWLFGHVNNMPVFLFPAIIVSLMKLQASTILKKFSSISLLTISVFSILYGKSATSIIGLLIIAFYIIIKSPKLNLIHYFLISLAFFSLIVVLGREYKVVYYISMFFNRSITFTGRTNIWNNALYYINKKPFLGHGLETPLMTMAKFNFITPHNRYLYILYTGGVLGFSFFTYFVFKIQRISKNNNKKYSNDIVYRSLYYTCCAIFIIFQMETYVGVLIYFPFILLANIKSGDMTVEHMKGINYEK